MGIPSPEAVPIARQPDKNIRLVHFYNYNRHNIYTVVVSEASPVRAWADLRGKILGVSSIASIGTALAEASLRAFGVNSAFTKFFSNGIVAREEFLQANPDALAALGRAVAKATVFAMENPEAAVRIHWKVYPDAKPKGLGEDKALKDAVFLLKEGLKIFDFKEGDRLRRWGAWDAEEWQRFADAMVELGVVKAKVPPTEVYMNAFVERFNAFDAAKVRAQARAYRGE